jgi:hypothetical protein
MKLRNPGVDHLAAETEAVGNLCDAFPLIQPQQGLGASELLGIACPRRQMFQGFSLCRIKGWESHRFTSSLRSGVMTQYTPVNRLLRTYLNITASFPLGESISSSVTLEDRSATALQDDL